MKKLFTLCLFIIIGICLQAQTFSWDITFLRGRTQESISISQIITMQTGEEFSIRITPASDCFAYVVAYDSDRQIIVLHAGAVQGGDNIYQRLRLTYPPGTETLYVIMSLTRQTELERLIRIQRNHPTSQRHTSNLFREVSRLQNAASRLGEPSIEIIPIGGTDRGISLGTRFSDRNLYVRPITIHH